MDKMNQIKNIIGVMFVCAALSVGAWTNVFEKETQREIESSGLVSVVHSNYIVIVYNNLEEGVEREILFNRHSAIELRYKTRWEDIQAGEDVLFRFTEIRQFRSGRNKDGIYREESFVKNRKLIRLEFARYRHQALVSS